MDAETLRASLAPNLPPDSVSWWPPGIGWLILIGLALLVFGVWLAWYSWHTPWWRWPRVKRLRRAYLNELAALQNTAQQAANATDQGTANASAFNRAVSHWLRRLMRDGLGVPPNLAPTQFHQACAAHCPSPLPDRLPTLLQRVYSPEPAYELFLATQEDLTQLCQTCLNLHSPGPG